MHRYTDLKLREITSQFNIEREKEESKIAVTMRTRGLVHSSAHIDILVQLGFDHIDRLIESLSDTEKIALSHDQKKLPEDYFVTLEQEFNEIVIKEMDITRDRIIKRVGNYSPTIANRVNLLMDKKGSYYKETINIVAERLKEELRLGMMTPSHGTTIHIEGDVGTINTGTVYGTVQGEIRKIRESNDNRAAELFDKLLDAVNNSEIPDNIKTEQMQNVEFIVLQYNKPKKERNYGLINASLNFLSAAANITTIWAQYGQVIMDILK